MTSKSIVTTNSKLVPAKKTVGVRGKVIQSQTREVVANVLKFMKKEAEKGGPIVPVTNYKQRVMQATGISDKVYRQVCTDLALIEAGKMRNFRNPSKKRENTFTIETVNGPETGDEMNQ